jgi:hypothetical protein
MPPVLFWGSQNITLNVAAPSADIAPGFFSTTFTPGAAPATVLPYSGTLSSMYVRELFHTGNPVDYTLSTIAGLPLTVSTPLGPSFGIYSETVPGALSVVIGTPIFCRASIIGPTGPSPSATIANATISVSII